MTQTFSESFADPSGRKKLALFDLDHTLLPLDSDHAWGQYTTAIGWTDAQAFQAKNDWFYEQYKAGTLVLADYIRFSVAAVARQGAIKSIAARADFISSVIEPAIKPAARALLDGHRRAGHCIVIITATNEFVTRPIADALGVADLVAVELARDASGWFTGELAGTPSFGPGKVTRMTQWLAAQKLGWSDVECTFYSDSINDLPLLEHVQHPVATNPDPRLRDIAQARGWRILDLFDSALP
jgi:HAD superfamily hydrolase (TIGR01490 family)